MNVRTLALWATVGVVGTSAGAMALPLPSPGAPEAGPNQSPTTVPIVQDPPVDPARVVMGKTLQVDARLGNATADGRNGTDTYLFTSIKAADATGAVAPPLHLAIVVDRSGSMKGDRMANATAAAIDTVERMREGDVVTVVSFDTQATVVVPPTTTSVATRPQIEANIRGIRLGGDTCISCGLEKGMEQLMNMTNANIPGDHVTRMLLLSDGATNSGIRDLPGLRAMAGKMRERGCTISTVGVDVDFDEKVMTAIASEANGNHYFVPNASKLNEIFAVEFASLVTTVAQNAELTIELAPGVEVDQVFDRKYRQEGNVLHVAFDNFSAKEEKTLLAKIHVPAGNDGNAPVATVKMNYRDVGGASDVENDGKLAIRLVSDGSEQKDLDPAVSARLTRSVTASTLNEVNDLVRSGDVNAAKAKLEAREEDLKKTADVARRAAGKGAPASVGFVQDLDKQLAVLSNADQNFAAAPPAAAATASPAQGGALGRGSSGPGDFAKVPAPVRPAPARATKAQVKQNAADALQMGF